jgi:hypothetical protein
MKYPKSRIEITYPLFVAAGPVSNTTVPKGKGRRPTKTRMRTSPHLAKPDD